MQCNPYYYATLMVTAKLILDQCYDPVREALTNSEKYFRNCFESKSRILVVNSTAVSVGQF